VELLVLHLELFHTLSQFVVSSLVEVCCVFVLDQGVLELVSLVLKLIPFTLHDTLIPLYLPVLVLNQVPQLIIDALILIFDSLKPLVEVLLLVLSL
jgi:hypothetical protein